MVIRDIVNQLPKHPTKKYATRSKPPTMIIVHCDDWATDAQTIAQYDVGPNHISSTGCPGFTYTYFINKDGTIDRGNDDMTISWHAGNFNKHAIGVCLSYKATGNTKPPAEVQIAALEWLCFQLCVKHGIDPDNILGHRELPGTGYEITNGVKKLRKTCPGLLVSLTNLRYKVATALQKFLKELKLYQGDIDGLFGPKSEQALASFYNNQQNNAG